jgi:hypothetical protein
MRRISPYIAVVFMLLANKALDAQCAMCKAVLESNSGGGGSLAGRGVNDGILYLMGFPYLLMFAVVVYIFRDHLMQALGIRKRVKA